MTRQMFDAAFPPEAPPADCQVAAGYLPGGLVYHAWTPEEWARVLGWAETQWVLPIRVADPAADGRAAGLETVAAAEQLGCPRGVALALDVEENMAEHSAQSGFHRAWTEAVAGSGFVPLIYTSEAAWATLQPGVHATTQWWIAAWTGEAHELPGAAATQWTSPTVDPALAVDLSTVVDALALWPQAGHGTETGGGPVAPTLAAPVCAIVPTPNGAGYWLVAEDGGTFAFGDAPHFPDPIPEEHLARPVVDAATTPKGDGLWLVGADGGVFALGAAVFHGSIPSLGIEPAAPEA